MSDCNRLLAGALHKGLAKAQIILALMMPLKQVQLLLPAFRPLVWIKHLIPANVIRIFCITPCEKPLLRTCGRRNLNDSANKIEGQDTRPDHIDNICSQCKDWLQKRQTSRALDRLIITIEFHQHGQLKAQ